MLYMACFVQVFIPPLTDRLKNNNTKISLPTLKLKNKSETDFFLGQFYPNDVTMSDQEVTTGYEPLSYMFPVYFHMI